MSDRIEYRRWWMENTTSRNAFYQVFDIVRRSDSGLVMAHAVVTHYGPLKVSEGSFSRPVIGGTVNVKQVSASDSVHDAINAGGAKQKTGYRHIASDAAKKQGSRAWITQHFGAVHGRNIEQALGLVEPIAEVDEPIVRVEDAVIDRGEVWGSW